MNQSTAPVDYPGVKLQTVTRHFTSGQTGYVLIDTTGTGYSPVVTAIYFSTSTNYSMKLYDATGDLFGWWPTSTTGGNFHVSGLTLELNDGETQLKVNSPTNAFLVVTYFLKRAS
jgi:hypothetical protein